MPGLSMEPVPVTRPTGESIVKLLDVWLVAGDSSPDGERPGVGAARPARGRVGEGQGHDVPAVHRRDCRSVLVEGTFRSASAV